MRLNTWTQEAIILDTQLKAELQQKHTHWKQSVQKCPAMSYLLALN